MANKKPLALIIMDGWGDNPVKEFNAVEAGKTPVLDSLVANYANTDIQASGIDVGLPDGQMGNSEVGHTNIGAGRIVYQELTRIGKAIADGDFFENKTLCEAVDAAVKADKAVHIMGLMSPGGVHSHQDHIVAMIKLAAKRGAKKIYFHAFTDGRDVAPRSALEYVKVIENTFKEVGVGKVATIVGRYYAMDRDNRWDRVQQAYDLLTQGKSEFGAFDSAEAAIQAAYDRDENDEFIKASVIGDKAPLTDGDSLIFMNFRADRARQITRSFVNADFDGFKREVTPKLASFVMLTQYAADIKTACAFPPADLTNTLGEWLSKKGMTQLRISETEKYAHVTFFFNGGVETVFPGEDRILIQSPKVATYDLQPEMSSKELTDKLCAAIESGKYDMIICNYPNGDMVGHTGVFEAAVKAVEAVDSCIGRVIESLKKVGGECLITADHGNCERMKDLEKNIPYTAHTNLPVPFIYYGRKATMRKDGRLSDIAPTMLYLKGMEIPAEMTGKSIVKLEEE
ncbi:2,3-bisphosphoglycerate-independent phosphoglycerate mutase [Succinivibrio dextrinosolvens]|jgi:2,3-bisphosphoglycerate-independent phosphoglycerate mutase|uniref:2,3-bisphosphoglycerate-independent phosphoglycerate mutase n=1 Tax=Succinivibrio dextrinosolvens DSM 3072 TaxID=1123324 RepID=A0A1T4UWZ5_9GAMM|nr:2,3-bisphosphoglycerate-independent phosphoglycerate mutase [Succinivibrio dextrinosolvens]MBE6423485.1 2,3-bisphosphoglycerate-independent phosphoglycerate mutase [Succinivibrio dextrinosolvens]MBQ3678194.1 2,3-bisphosphoglycerate-independent phosphoglycerate mutase [Succinivibrio sp.]SKA57194.1 phosphoglycerate mutase [Succinivibrio dextrinosolvens DSM 3072]